MKTKKLLQAFIAFLLLAACSADETVDENTLNLTQQQENARLEAPIEQDSDGNTSYFELIPYEEEGGGSSSGSNNQSSNESNSSEDNQSPQEESSTSETDNQFTGISNPNTSECHQYYEAGYIHYPKSPNNNISDYDYAVSYRAQLMQEIPYRLSCPVFKLSKNFYEYTESEDIGYIGVAYKLQNAKPHSTRDEIEFSLSYISLDSLYKPLSYSKPNYIKK